MLIIILQILLWVMIFFYGISAFLTLCKSTRYRDVAIDLDAERIAPVPFQPTISVVVRCDLSKSKEVVERVRELLSINYIRYEIVLIMDSWRNAVEYQKVVDTFEMECTDLPDKINTLRYPPRAVCRSRSPLYKRLVVIDKVFYGMDDLRYTGAAICKADYMVWVRSIDNQLTRNSLARLAIMIMRDAQQGVVSVRGAARYSCDGPLTHNIFRIMADLCNLRRIYVGGSSTRNDFGHYIILESLSGKKGREEYVPKPQMYLHRKNNLMTYINQLSPSLRFLSFKGKCFAMTELLISFLFWAATLTALLNKDGIGDEEYLACSVLLLPLLASTFSIFIGEIVQKRNYKVSLILRLLVVSTFENIFFCALKPFVWFGSKFIKQER